MSSQERSPGTWADKLTQAGGLNWQPVWDQTVPHQVPLTPAAVDRSLKNCGKLLLMGLATMLVGAGLLALDLDVVLNGEQTSGRIVDHRPGPRGYVPVAAFYVDGQRYVARGNVSSRNPIYEIGDAVSVRYLPDDPTRAEIGGFFQLYLFPTVVAAIGLTFVVLALGCRAYVLRKVARR